MILWMCNGIAIFRREIYMSNAIEQQKNRLRKTMQNFTCRLPADYMDYSDQGILKTLLSLTEWKQAHTVFLYNQHRAGSRHTGRDTSGNQRR